MIYRVLSSFVLIALALVPHSLKSQCTPDTTITGLYSPSDNEGLPAGLIGFAYDATVHLKIPAETTVVIFTLNIDSAALIEFTGLPDGITYECSSPDCVFPGGDFSCIQLSGTPSDSSDVGSNPLVVTFRLYASGAFTTTYDFSITDYDIELSNTSLGIGGEAESSSVFFENPIPQGSDLLVRGAEPLTGLKLHSLDGRLIYSVNSLPAADFALPTAVLPTGVYVVSMAGAKNSLLVIR